MSLKIALSAGHGAFTAGKRCVKKLDSAETREWVLNARIASKVETLLRGYADVEVLRTDDVSGQRDVSLAERTAAAEAFGADFYLSLHHNAGVLGGAGGGIVAYVHTQAGEEAKLWQRQLYDALVAATGLKGNRATPLAKKNLKELRLAAMPAVLLELGFMDSRTDVPVILSESYADECAAAIVQVIAERAGLTKKPTNAAPSQSPPCLKGGDPASPGRGDSSTPEGEPTTSPKLYRVQVGAFSSRQNAEKLKQRLCAAGFPEAYIRAE